MARYPARMSPVCVCCRSASICSWRLPTLARARPSPAAWRAVCRACGCAPTVAVARPFSPRFTWRRRSSERAVKLTSANSHDLGSRHGRLSSLSPRVVVPAASRLSPLVRGTQLAAAASSCRVPGRSIPARAGQPCTPDHARHAADDRSIPARAGQPLTHAASGAQARVHPRARGAVGLWSACTEQIPAVAPRLFCYGA